MSIKLWIEKMYGVDKKHVCMDGDCYLRTPHDWAGIIVIAFMQLVIIGIFLAFILCGTGVIKIH